jgi:FADH2 O2-dependent halogenase
MEINLTTQVCIIGGGPAGATLASYLSKEGIDNVVVEKDEFPRHHIGESLIASTTPIFHDIGVLQKIDEAGFIKKRGAVWVPQSGRGEQVLTLAPPPEFGRDHTFQVERAKFDQIMLNHAQSLGTKVLQPAKAIDIIKSGDRINGIIVKQDDEQINIKADYVIDASGQGTMLGSKLKLKKNDPNFNQVALYGYFNNVDLGATKTEGYIHIFFLPGPKAWVWQIPISKTVTSIGVVTRKEEFKTVKSSELQTYFWQQVNSNPTFKQRMSGAKQVGDLRTAKDYSFEMTSKVGPGFMLIGDAARFVDPIFSSGISIAMTCAQFAFNALHQIIEGDKTEQLAFAEYEELITRGTKVWSEFIAVYYRMQNLFSYYIQHPDYKEELIQLLQGNVYQDNAIDVLERMKDDIKIIESNPKHLLHKALVG